MDNTVNASTSVDASRQHEKLAQAPARMQVRDAGQMPATARPVQAATLERAVTRIKDFVQIAQRDLEFSVDEDTGRTIITVRDSESGEVVRQIPPEDLISAAENLDQALGLLFDGAA